MDAFDNLYWTLIQLLEWVFLRDRNQVGRIIAYEGIHESFWEEAKVPYISDKAIGTSAIALPPINPLRMISASGLGAACENVERAEDAVLAVLREGKLTATALKNGEGDRVQVPLIEWPGLNFFYYPPHAGPQHSFPNATRWFGLRFKRSEILAIWSDRQEPALRVIPEAPPPEGERPAGGATSQPRTAPAKVNKRRRGAGHKPGEYLRYLREYLETLYKFEGGMNFFNNTPPGKLREMVRHRFRIRAELKLFPLPKRTQLAAQIEKIIKGMEKDPPN